MHVGKINSFSKLLAFILIPIVFLSDALHGGILQLKPREKIDCGNPTIVANPKTISFRDNNPLLPRIIGGEPADPLAWPWQAYVSIFGENTGSCGATLISSEWLLTAAHCVKGIVQDVSVYLGIKYASERDNDANKNVVSLVVRHSGYDSITKQNDIALLKLRTPVKYSTKIRPACLSDEDLAKPDQDAVLTGWGLTSKGVDGSGTRPNQLYQVKVPIKNNYDCENSMKQLSNKQICIGDFKKKPKVFCDGDSGGPLVVRRDKVFVVGIISFGTPLCDYFAVTARVWEYNSWILNVTATF